MLYSYFQTLSKCFGENPQSPAPPFLGAVLPLRWIQNIISIIFLPDVWNFRMLLLEKSDPEGFAKLEQLQDHVEDLKKSKFQICSCCRMSVFENQLKEKHKESFFVFSQLWLVASAGGLRRGVSPLEVVLGRGRWGLLREDSNKRIPSQGRGRGRGRRRVSIGGFGKIWIIKIPRWATSKGGEGAGGRGGWAWTVSGKIWIIKMPWWGDSQIKKTFSSVPAERGRKKFFNCIHCILTLFPVPCPLLDFLTQPTSWTTAA